MNIDLIFDLNTEKRVDLSIKEPEAVTIKEVIQNLLTAQGLTPEKFTIFTFSDKEITLSDIEMPVKEFVSIHGTFIGLIFQETHGSLSQNTKIHLSSVKEIPFHELHTGMNLLSYNPARKVWANARVQRIHTSFITQKVILNEILSVIPSQRILMKSGKWKMAKNIQKGDKIMWFDGTKRVHKKITSTKKTHNLTQAYNLTLSNNHSFIANNMILHNDDDVADLSMVDPNVNTVISMSSKNKKDYDKYFGIKYFEVMNPNNVYRLTINISDRKIEKQASIENVLTGEKQSHEVKKTAFSLPHGEVKVQPIIPGCLVTPAYIYTNFDSKKDELGFDVTPIINGPIEGHIELLQDNIEFHTMELKMDVKDPRYARVFASYGILTSFFPRILELLDLNWINNANMGDIFPKTPSILSTIALPNFIAMAGTSVVAVIGLFYYLSLKPSKDENSLAFMSLKKLADTLEKEVKPMKLKAKMKAPARPQMKKKNKMPIPTPSSSTSRGLAAQSGFSALPPPAPVQFAEQPKVKRKRSPAPAPVNSVPPSSPSGPPAGPPGGAPMKELYGKVQKRSEALATEFKLAQQEIGEELEEDPVAESEMLDDLIDFEEEESQKEKFMDKADLVFKQAADSEKGKTGKKTAIGGA